MKLTKEENNCETPSLDIITPDFTGSYKNESP